MSPRKLIIVVAAAATLLCLSSSLAEARSGYSPARSAMSIRILKRSGPHTISRPHGLITFYFGVTGLRYGRNFGPTAKNRHGQGHIEMYMNAVPGDAHRKPDVRHIFNGAITSLRSVSIAPDAAWLKIHKGRHTLLAVLAQNDGVLYRVTPARFSLVVN